MTIDITIPGTPIAKKRPRFARRGKFVVTYNDQESEEKAWAAQAIKQIPVDKIPLSGPVELTCLFSIERPKSHYGKKGLRPKAPRFHVQKPDVDNYAKAVMDCLNRCGVWGDDCQVVHIQAAKRWSDIGFTKIGITQIV